MSELSTYSDLKSSLWLDNPMLVHLLGISPLLAVSDSATKALALGIGLLLACALSAITVWVVREYINGRWEILWSALILASYTSLFALVLQLNFFLLFRELGIYVMLIPCNFAILLKMPSYAKSSSWQKLSADSIILGLSLLLAMVLFAVIRELLYSGTAFYGWQILIPNALGGSELILENRESVMQFMRLQPAAFLLLGLIAAGLKLTRTQNVSPAPHRSSSPIKRARVTGRLKNIKEDP